MNVKIRKVHADAQIPQYATDGAAGFDLVAVDDIVIAPGETALVPLGLAFEIPQGYEMQIRPRSGISLRTKLRIANAPATLDSDYRGEVAVIVDNIANVPQWENYARYIDNTGAIETLNMYPSGTYIIRKGDRIAQGVIAPVAQANFVITSELSGTSRGSSGFGSTGTSA